MKKLALCETRGPLVDLIDKLSGEDGDKWLDGLKKFLRGELVVSAANLLKQVGAVAVGACARFVAKDHFIVDTGDQAKVKIGYLGGNFREHFLPKVEEGVTMAELAVHRLERNSLDAPFLAELGNKAETTLAYLYELLSKQSEGGVGILLIDGRWNVFYIRDTKGTLWAVDAHWSAHYGDWGVYAYPVTDPNGWNAGNQVLSQVA